MQPCGDEQTSTKLDIGVTKLRSGTGQCFMAAVRRVPRESVYRHVGCATDQDEAGSPRPRIGMLGIKRRRELIELTPGSGARFNRGRRTAG